MKIGISKWALVLFFLSTVGVFAQDNKPNPQPQQNGNAASVKPGDAAKEKLKEFKAAFSKSKSEAEKIMLLQSIRDLESKESLSELSKIAKGDKYEGVRKAAIVQIGDRYRGKEAAVALKDAFVSALQKQIKELQILAVEQMGRMASLPVATAKDKNVRQTTVFKPDPKTTEYASIFLNWLIATQYKGIDVDLAVAALNSIGKLRSRMSVDPLLDFLKYYENQQSQLSQQVKEVDSSKLAQMRDQAKQAQQSKAAAAQQPSTTTTTTTTTNSGSSGGSTPKITADDAKAVADKYGLGDLNNALGGGDLDYQAVADQANDLMGQLGGLGGGGAAPTTTTTTTTQSTPATSSTPSTSTSSGSSMNASDALVTTGQTYAQRFPQLDARCKKLVPATVNSLKGVTKQGYYGWADWTKWWDRSKAIWKPE